MRQCDHAAEPSMGCRQGLAHVAEDQPVRRRHAIGMGRDLAFANIDVASRKQRTQVIVRSEEHTSELQSQSNLVCRLLLEKKKKNESRSVMCAVRDAQLTST